jgi:hypothetical protein
MRLIKIFLSCLVFVLTFFCLKAQSIFSTDIDVQEFCALELVNQDIQKNKGRKSKEIELEKTGQKNDFSVYSLARYYTQYLFMNAKKVL